MGGRKVVLVFEVTTFKLFSMVKWFR